MAKTVSWKIDFLMKVTGTSNSELARRLGFDASYISRIRRGKRGLPPEQPFIDPASAVFAKLVRDDYQRRVIAEEIGCAWPANPAEGRDLLAAWLRSEPIDPSGVLGMVRALDARPMPEPDAVDHVVRNGSPASVQLFYGNAGKRDAVVTFLSPLCATGEPHTLLLHSDEDMTWLYEDAAFARQWAGLLAQLATNGGKIRIIHEIARDANEMWEAVRKWTPLYMTGAVEPYYYPHLRGGALRRTLFVAPGHSAIVASSIQGGTGEGLNMLVEDASAVTALEAEFDTYLKLCRPLMQASFPETPADMGALVTGFAIGCESMLAALEDGKLVCASESGHALAANVESPLVAFDIEEPRMASAVWEYLDTLPAEGVAQGAEAQALLAGVADDLANRG